MQWDSPGATYNSGLRYDDAEPLPLILMKKIKLLLAEKTIDEKVTQGTSIKNGMTGNPNFTTPNPSLATLGTVTTTLQTKAAARVAAFEAAKAATADLHAAEATYDQTITQLAAYAENITGGDTVKLESANFELRNPPTPVTSLGQVEHLKVVTNGFPGRFNLTWDVLKGSSLYQVAISVDPPTETSWQTLKATRAARLRVDELPSGQRRAVRVRGRNKLIDGQWSDPVTRVVP